MDYELAKERLQQLQALCNDVGVEAVQIVLQQERDDYAEAIRVVLEYLP